MVHAHVGLSARWTRPDPGVPVHVVVLIAARPVLACTGAPAAHVRVLDLNVVRDQLTCWNCRTFWRHVMDPDTPIQR